MKELIEKSLKASITFKEYFQTVERAVQGELMYNDENLDYYTQLNYQRMKRLNKTINLNDGILEASERISCNLIWLVLTEGWCGDAAQVLPVLQKVDDAVANVELRVLYRDENLELMDQFLTNGGRSIPKVIVIDKETLEVKGSWGPRPEPAQDMFLVYKNSEPKKDYKEFQAEMQKWYVKDKAEHIQKELQPLFDLCQTVPT